MTIEEQGVRESGGAPLMVECSGHPAIKASHAKSWELVSEDDITSSATCIIGTRAEYDEDVALALRGRVRITLTCGDVSDVVEARINPLFRRGDPLIVRRNPVPQVRSFCIGATKGANGLTRELVAELTRAGARLKVVFERIAGELAGEGALYVVATPIGNPDDISMRALDVLSSVDLILAEDTRTTRALLTRHGIRGKLMSYHDHNEHTRAREILERLRHGARIALVSEAGTPMVSDPGYRIVSAASASDVPIAITPIPGANAVTTALSVTGVPAEGFRFVGFLPRKRSDSRRRLEDVLAASTGAVVFFDTVQRIDTTLAILAELAPDREIAICADLTKPSERIVRGPPAAVADELAAVPLRGELTVVVASPPQPAAKEPQSLSEEVVRLLSELSQQDVPTKVVASALARATGMARRDAFNYLLTLKISRQ